MFDEEALMEFRQKRVNSEMVHYLVETTSSLIKVKPSRVYPSPPHTPVTTDSPNNKPLVSLFDFICALIKHSNVQTPTLMSTLVYLARLKTILPANSYGIETTRHRIFLGCLILAAKNLNDSSPVNKHWARYTDGLLSNDEVNTIERELLEYLNWDLTITHQDLTNSLAYFLSPIKAQLKRRAHDKLLQQQKLYVSTTHASSSTRLSSMLSPPVTPSSSMSSMPSMPSLMSASSSRSTLSSMSSSSSSLNERYRVTQQQQQPVILEEETITSTRPLKLKNMNTAGYTPRKDVHKRSSTFNLLNASTRVAC